MKKIKVGNVILFKYNTFVSNVIASILGHYWTHVGWIVKINDNKIYIQEAVGTSKILGQGKVKTIEYDIDSIYQLFNQNRLKILDFKIKNNNSFKNIVKAYEDLQYDYFSAFNIGWKKIFGFTQKSKKETTKKLFCSEMILRGIDELTKISTLHLLNLKSFEEGTPQHISLLDFKLKCHLN